MCSAPCLSVTCGGTQNEFIRAIVLSKKRPIRVLTDRDVAAEVALVANEELVPVPGVSMSRGLRGDLEGLLTGADGPLVVVPHALIHAHLKARAKRLSQDMDIIAGYPPPPDLVIRCVIVDLRELVLRVAERGRSPLAIHDTLGVIAPVDAPEIVFFTEPAKPPVPAASADIAPAEQDLDENDDGEEIDLDLVRSHAEFVADSAPDDLRRMCPLLAEPSSAPLRAFWRRQIARLENDDFSEWLHTRANRLMSEAFGD